MKKLASLFIGCLTGMILLVLGIFIVSAVDSYLYNSPLHYEKLERVASPDAKAYAHFFTNTNKRNSLTPYSGVCITSGKKISRKYEDEVLSISPPCALKKLNLIWLDNQTLEISFLINSDIKSSIRYGKTPSTRLGEIIFTELHDPANSDTDQENAL